MVHLGNDWDEILAGEFEQDYYKRIRYWLKKEYAEQTIYPAAENIFNALRYTPYSKVKAVILGQDPYHEPGQANGLAFSVRPGIKLPPSLQNIYKELEADLSVPAAKNGDLTNWARQGVFLLNTVLSVQAHRANAHKDFGWQTFTDAVIAALGSLPQPIAFLLWGAQAQKKAAIIRQSPHPRLILESPHPSPLSAYRGFFGSRPFSQVNAFLLSCGFPAIDWKIPEDAQNTALGG